MLSSQEIFDKVVNALRKQGVKSIVEGKGVIVCCYRQDQTAACPTRCAAGHLIPDHLYSPNMEGFLFARIWEEFAEIRPLISKKDVWLVNCLQLIHDNHPVTEWESKWQHLAYRLSLTYHKPS